MHSTELSRGVGGVAARLSKLKKKLLFVRVCVFSYFFVQFGLGFAIFAIDVSQNTVKQKLTNTIYSATRYPSPTPIIRDRHHPISSASFIL